MKKKKKNESERVPATTHLYIECRGARFFFFARGSRERCATRLAFSGQEGFDFLARAERDATHGAGLAG